MTDVVIEDTIERDKELIWHPFTQQKTVDPCILIERGSGSYLYDKNDKAYFDLVSSWWVNIHGHANPHIARAIYEQSVRLEHVIFAGYTHRPAVRICSMLKELLPASLTKFFFSDDGSTAVEVALKMCCQYYANVGRADKTKFLCFDGAYHGDTFGAMSVGVGSGYHDKFKKLLFSVHVIPYPDTWYDDPDVDRKEDEAVRALTDYLETDADRTAAFIMEPLIQGAAGMRMCRPSFVKRTVDLIRRYDVRVIFDEIFVGFGRTGTYFAVEQIDDAVPDIICLSKGLTGGFLPLALTVTTDEIYDAFLNYEHVDGDRTFYHGHSYTANPLGCAAAIASLKLLTDSTTLRSINDINEVHEKNLRKLRNDCGTLVERIRVKGTVAAFDVKNGQIVKDFKRKCLQNGLIIRPLGTTVYLLPPYCTTKDELDKAYATITGILQSFVTQ